MFEIFPFNFKPILDQRTIQLSFSTQPVKTLHRADLTHTNIAVNLLDNSIF